MTALSLTRQEVKRGKEGERAGEKGRTAKQRAGEGFLKKLEGDPNLTALSFSRTGFFQPAGLVF